MITRAEWIRELSITLAGTDYENESHAIFLSSGCTAMLLGKDYGGSKDAMERHGFKSKKFGNERKYRRDEVFEVYRSHRDEGETYDA